MAQPSQTCPLQQTTAPVGETEERGRWKGTAKDIELEVSCSAPKHSVSAQPV